jgi:endonuclease YncB( thermonuclease family)
MMVFLLAAILSVLLFGRRFTLVWISTLISLLLIGVFVLAAAHRPARSQTYTQKPVPLPMKTDTRVIDGDTIVQGTTHYRLYGIDAPELGQRCSDGWPAGEKAKGFLIALITGGVVVCDNRGYDRYGRTLAVCTAHATNLNQAMVRTGNAMAYSQYSRDYVLDEIGARNAKAGMWAHNCQAPWDYRHGGAAQGGKSGR